MWSEIVSKEVDSKLSGVTAEIKSLQQTSQEIQMSRGGARRNQQAKEFNHHSWVAGVQRG